MSQHRRLLPPYSCLRDRSINDVFFRYVANYTYDWESWHDPAGNLIWVNDAVQRMTGYSAEECLGMPNYPLPIVSEKDRPRMRRMLDDAISKKSHNDLEFEILSRDGQERWMAVSWQPMFGDEGEHLGFRTSVRDITDRRGLKEQLRLYTEHLEQLVQERTARIAQLEQNRRQMEKLAALGELAAGVAHEVNNPLAGIRNAFALFRSTLAPQHEHYDLLELVDKEIERISSIIHQMYQLYRRNPEQVVEFELSKAIGEVICLLEPIARRYQVYLVTNGQHQVPLVTLPEGELKQVLFNLIRNAIQASEPEQTVKVVVQLSGDHLQIQVIDQGSGIEDDVLKHIFDPFFTTKSTLKEGMGLGLSVSRNLIEAMSGSIGVRTKVGEGSTFTITLPYKINCHANPPAEKRIL
jgi:two-component system, sporulation sensor kinase C